MLRKIKNNKIVLLQFVLMLVLTTMPVWLYAQTPGFEEDETDVPFDGGLSLVIAAGVGYGLHKVRQSRARRQADDVSQADK